MRFTFTVEVEVERIEGKFASRDDIETELVALLDEANYGEVSGIGADGASVYEITDWTVTEARSK